jgi:hypothetical protein
VIVIARVLPRLKMFVNTRLGDVTIPDPVMRFMHRGKRRRASGGKSDSLHRSPQ